MQRPEASAASAVPAPATGGVVGAPGWPEGASHLAEQLLQRLAIGDRDWHAVKNQPSRRAAEQLAAALVQLLNGEDPRRREGGEAQQRAIALVENGLGWLQGSLSDPGCPRRSGAGRH